MDVLKLQSTKAYWNTKCPFHILAYMYSNVLDISTSHFIKILSCRERLDVDSQRTKKCTFHLDFRGERVEKKEKWTYEISKNDFIMMPFILIWLKIKTDLLKMVLNTFIWGGGHFHSKVIGMLVVFLGMKLWFWYFWGILENGIHFP